MWTTNWKRSIGSSSRVGWCRVRCYWMHKLCLGMMYQRMSWTTLEGAFIQVIVKLDREINKVIQGTSFIVMGKIILDCLLETFIKEVTESFIIPLYKDSMTMKFCSICSSRLRLFQSFKFMNRCTGQVRVSKDTNDLP